MNYRFEKFERKRVVTDDDSEEEDDYIDPATYDTDYESEEE